jgi:hypothetical protein
MIRNSQAASSTVLPLIVIVMEVVSSKGFGLMELDTVCCWAKVPIEKKNIKSIVFHSFLNFKKRLSDSLFNMFNTLWLIWYH